MNAERRPVETGAASKDLAGGLITPILPRSSRDAQVSRESIRAGLALSALLAGREPEAERDVATYYAGYAIRLRHYLQLAVDEMSSDELARLGSRARDEGASEHDLEILRRVYVERAHAEGVRS